MPVRSLLYDGLGYLKECNEFRNMHRIENNFDSDTSFLSGMNKSDKIHPIITLIFYYGESPWNGPITLSDMMTDIPDELRPFFSDYKINLIQILDSEHYQFYNEDVKNVFDITQKIYSKNLQGLAEEYTNKSIDSEIKVQKERQTAIITMIELGLTKEQILTKYSEEDYLKAEKALNNKKN